MADDKLAEGTSVSVAAISKDWDWGVSGDTGDKRPKLASLTFVPGADTDKLVVKDGSDTGPVIFNAHCVLEEDTKVKYFHGARKRPYVDFDLCSLSANHLFLIDLWPSKR